jgi:hypothetical protein
LSKTCGGRRWKKALAHVNSWLTAWQSPRRRWDNLKVSRRCGGKAKPRGAWPVGGGHRRVNPLRLPGKGEVRRESSEWSPAHRRRGFLPGGTYPMATAHESQRPAINGDGPPAARKRGGFQDLLQLTDTVPSEPPFSCLTTHI